MLNTIFHHESLAPISNCFILFNWILHAFIVPAIIQHSTHILRKAWPHVFEKGLQIVVVTLKLFLLSSQIPFSIVVCPHHLDVKPDALVCWLLSCSNDNVSKRAEELLKKKAAGVNFEDLTLIKRLFSIFQGHSVPHVVKSVPHVILFPMLLNLKAIYVLFFCLCLLLVQKFLFVELDM